MKELMDGYEGVKFEARQVKPQAPDAVIALANDFISTCLLLKLHDMTPANGGNISQRVNIPGKPGPCFIITSSGCNLGSMEPSELILVEACDTENGTVDYHGPTPPSSESMLHDLIYRARPGVTSIIHAHDEFATRPELLEGLVTQTEQEEAYGTMELARQALTAIGPKEQIIVLKNHGYVAVGNLMADALKLILDTHIRLVSKK